MKDNIGITPADLLQKDLQHVLLAVWWACIMTTIYVENKHAKNQKVKQSFIYEPHMKGGGTRSSPRVAWSSLG